VARLPADWQPEAGSLAGRVILVTGAYGGLGSAVVRAATLAGATVVITGKRKRQLEKLYDAMREEGLAEPVIHPLDMEVATPRVRDGASHVYHLYVVRHEARDALADRL